jgi:mannose-6-phosphate isomerase
MLYPLTFEPRYEPRVWGGRRLASLYGRDLPGTEPIGESWELVDRPEAVSAVANGPWAGRSLRWLMERYAEPLAGALAAPSGRFPWLIKLLDARQRVSVQVHPPARAAARLGGEPKTELWHVTDAGPDAVVYAGFDAATDRESFRAHIDAGTVAEVLHVIPVRTGDTLFVPSGRLHALGAGVVIAEIQQSSDTTYRVFDWNRVGLDGRPRALHVEQALESIDFDDVRPALVQPRPLADDTGLRRLLLVDEPLFRIESVHAVHATALAPAHRGQARLVGLLRGAMTVRGGGEVVGLGAGAFCLLPAALEGVRIEPEAGAFWLEVAPGTAASPDHSRPVQHGVARP